MKVSAVLTSGNGISCSPEDENYKLLTRNVLTTNGLIVMTFGSDIYIPVRMICNNFGDLITFLLVPS